MNSRLIVLVALACVFPGCASLTDEQEQFLVEARRMENQPFKRSKLVSALDLNSVGSERSGGGIALNGAIQFREAWNHPCGLTIAACYSERVDVYSTRIDQVLNTPTSEAQGSMNLGPPFPESPIFQYFSVSRGSKVLYWSYESQGEQDADVQAAAVVE